jgi:hypothetical protein
MFKHIIVAIALLGSVSAHAEETIEFAYGPNPRSLDNKNIFDIDSYFRRKAWGDLKSAGVDSINLNASSLIEHEYIQPNQTVRHPLTYLDTTELYNLKTISETNEMKVNYEAGYGFGGTYCGLDTDPDNSQMQALAIKAADDEFYKVTSRLLNVGIPIDTINVDGIFLRLISGAKKVASCGAQNIGFNIEDTVMGAQTYMKHLRNRINLHPTHKKNQREVKVNWLINLTNWTVNGQPRGNLQDTEYSDVDLIHVITKFNHLQKIDKSANPLKIEGIVIDYPKDFVNSNPGRFRDKLFHIWNSVNHPTSAKNRMNNDGQQIGFSFIINGIDLHAECLIHQPSFKDINFIPYRTSKGAPMKENCMKTQWATDNAYFAQTVNYANAILNDEPLDGRRLSEVITQIDSLVFQTWGENPLTNLRYMDQLQEYLAPY